MNWPARVVFLASMAATPLAANPAPTLDAQTMARIDRYVTTQLDHQHLPGIAIGIFRDGHSILSKGYGLADIERHVPVTPGTLMETGSIGKQFTATAIMMLVDQNRLKLTDPITRHFPELPATWSSIQIANLLSHTSGIGDYFPLLSFGPGGTLDLYRDYSQAEILAVVAKRPIEFPAGEKWEYSNVNYLLLGYLVERISGESRNAFLKRHVFEPLGMSTARGLSEREIIPDRAVGYVVVGGVIQHQHYVSDSFASTGDGGLLLSVNDYERWDKGLRDGKLLSRESLSRMWTPFVLKDGTVNRGNYGFGWFLSSINGHRVIEHGGEISGFNTMLSRYPDRGLTVVAIGNLDRSHSSVLGIAHVVAGMVDPALMPKPATPIADDDPELGTRLVRTLDRVVAGENVADAFVTDAGYQFDRGDGADAASLLPPGWRSSPPRLVKRSRSDGVVRSTYRIGPPGNARQLYAGTDEQGRLWDFVISPDPDAR